MKGKVKMDIKDFKIISDSSSDIYELEGIDYESVPLKIILGDKEYVDKKGLDVDDMVMTLKAAREKSTTSCPNPNDYIEAFGDAKNIFAITITSALSGSYNSLVQAKEMYKENNPDANIYCIDSLSTGPEMYLIIRKLKEYIKESDSFEEVCEKIENYKKHTHLLYCLQSLTNLANNGRVSPAVVKIAGVLGIRMLGTANSEGRLNLLHKARGDKKTIELFIQEMKNMNYKKGFVSISHCLNENLAGALSNRIKEEFKDVVVEIRKCTALCSYYAEYGGILVGFDEL